MMWFFWDKSGLKEDRSLHENQAHSLYDAKSQMQESKELGYNDGFFITVLSFALL